MRHIYEARGFNVTGIHVDNEFNVAVIVDSQQPALMYIYRRGEYIGVIERSNRTEEENYRAMTHALPYKKVPKLMVLHWLQGRQSR